MEKHLLPLFAVINGVPLEGSYCFGFRFVPSTPEEEESRGTLLIQISLKSTEKIDLRLLGTQLVNSLHEAYYQDLETTIPESIKKGLAEVPNKLKEILPTIGLHSLDIQMTLAVVWGQFLYLGRLEKGEVYLKRGGPIVPINFTKIASGRLQNLDWLFLANSNFWQALSPETLRPILEESNFEESLRKIDQIVGKSSDISCVLAYFNVEEDLGEADKLKLIDPSILTNSEKVRQVKTWVLKNGQLLLETALKFAKLFLEVYLPSLIRKLSRRRKRRPGEVSVASSLGKPKKRWRLILPLLILVVTLGLFGNLYFKNQAANKTEAKDLLAAATEKKNEAVNLQTLNGQKARELLTEAQAKLEEAKKKGSQDKSIESLEKEISDLLATLRREYRFAQLPLFYDLSSLKTNLDITSLAFRGENILALDKNNGSLLLLDLKEKKGSVVVNDSKLKGGTKMQINGSVVFVSGGDKIVRLDLDSKEFLSDISLNTLVKDFSLYNSSLYFLNSQTLKKALLTAEGASSPTNYLTSTGVELGEAKAVSVDGFVWVLTKEGLLKLSRGAREDFSLSGLEKSLTDPQAIFSAETTNFLYVIDKKNSRVVAIEKTGSYYAQYITPQMEEISSILVDESKNRLYLAGKDKIYLVEVTKGE